MFGFFKNGKPLIEELNIVRELGNANVSPIKVVPATAPLLDPSVYFKPRTLVIT